MERAEPGQAEQPVADQGPTEHSVFDAGQVLPAGSQTTKLDTVSRPETGSNPGSHFPYLYSDLQDVMPRETQPDPLAEQPMPTRAIEYTTTSRRHKTSTGYLMPSRRGQLIRRGRVGRLFK